MFERYEILMQFLADINHDLLVILIGFGWVSANFFNALCVVDCKTSIKVPEWIAGKPLDWCINILIYGLGFLLTLRFYFWMVGMI